MKCRIDLVIPCALRTGHNIEIIEIASGCGGDDVIAFRDQDKVSIVYGDRFIKILPGVYALEGEPIARRDVMVIGLLKIGFIGRIFSIVFVRRKRGPVARRCDDFDEDQPLRFLVGVQNVLDATPRIAFTSQLYAYILRTNDAGRKMPVRGRRAGDGDLHMLGGAY